MAFDETPSKAHDFESTAKAIACKKDRSVGFRTSEV
ncbi:hypothetical protein [Inovirus D_HF5_75]|nr:hypothetical protein [Inovirus D_HF3_12]WMC01076.1 hypothetical protein [Inovirus D_HF4_80]WMC01088.1 hypothetical protein [Inovirus D_HF5_75]DAK45541.1 MAG TPA: hypothetical protein [Inoviridae sp.]DAM36848.1 MAG TPA: hypothetical protein [Inoviridae sp.]